MVFQPPATCVYSSDSNSDFEITSRCRDTLQYSTQGCEVILVIKDARLGSFVQPQPWMDKVKNAQLRLVPSLHGCHGNHRNMDPICFVKRSEKPKNLWFWRDPFSTEQLALLEEGSHQIQISAPNLSWKTHFSPNDFLKKPLCFSCWHLLLRIYEK